MTSLIQNPADDDCTGLVSKYKQMELNGELEPEPLLQENPNRFVLFPIEHHKVWDMYKKAEASFWTAEELDLAHDLKDWLKLTDDERFFIKQVEAHIHKTHTRRASHRNRRAYAGKFSPSSPRATAS